MDSRKIVLQETSVIAIGEAICYPLMLLAFYLCGAFDRTVVIGGIAGALIATANFFFMALSTSLAADKAQAQDIKGGQSTIQFSYFFLCFLNLTKSFFRIFYFLRRFFYTLLF